MTLLARNTFLILSMHAKLHHKLDRINAAQGGQARASHDQAPQNLDALKAEMLGISFLEEKS